MHVQPHRRCRDRRPCLSDLVDGAEHFHQLGQHSGDIQRTCVPGDCHAGHGLFEYPRHFCSEVAPQKLRQAGVCGEQLVDGCQVVHPGRVVGGGDPQVSGAGDEHFGGGAFVAHPSPGCGVSEADPRQRRVPCGFERASTAGEGAHGKQQFGEANGWGLDSVGGWLLVGGNHAGGVRAGFEDLRVGWLWLECGERR